jgi:AhpD family alkylhydroperoxidase
MSSIVRIEPLPAPRRSLFTRLVRWFGRRKFGRDLAPIDVYAHSGPLLAASGCFELAIERAHAVDPKLRALAELKTAAIVGCPFCIDIGSALARSRGGVTEQQVRELHAYATSSAFTQLERRVLDFAVAMTQTPVRVEDSAFAALREQLGERAMVELAAAIAWENFRARLNHALGVPVQGFSEGAVCALPQPA